jgi:membrane fusion protein (multidrug efflux system)
MTTTPTSARQAKFRGTTLALLALAVFSQAHAQGGQMPPTQVEVAKPKQQSLATTLNAVGSMRAGEAITVRPEVPGRIDAVLFTEGEKVEKGTLLFRLDAALARADLAEAEATANNTSRELRRAEEMQTKKLIAPSDADAKRAAANVDAAKLASSRTRLAKTEIRAPFAGVVGLRKVSAGEYVASGDALVDLVQVDPIKLDFSIPETQLGKVQTGQAIAVTLDAWPGQKFVGSVYAVAPQVDAATRTLQLRAQLANPDGKLKPGQFARVALETGRNAAALVIPEQALWPQGQQQNVYLVKDGKAELKPITIGQRSAGLVEVIDGLSVNDTVIIAGQLKIGPGMPVQPIESGSGGGNAPAAAAGH